jgi:hypothetical protein
MSDRSELTRRKVLAAASAVGLGSLSAGLGTSATFSNRADLGGRVEAGAVALAVDCDSCTTAGGTVEFEIDGIEPGSGWDEETIRVSIPSGTNAVRVWGRTTCPETLEPLATALEVQLTVDDCSGGNRREISPPAFAGTWLSLDEFRRGLADGFRIDDPDDPCLDPGETYCLTLRYRLPTTASWAVAAEATLGMEFYAEQCRHVDESAVGEGPFADVWCPGFDCPDCVELGKIDVVGDRLIAGERYDLELAPGFDGDGDYEIEVLSVTNKQDDTGDEETVCAGFRLLRDGVEAVETPLCEVTVGGGRPRSPPSDPDSRVAVYDIDPPLSRTSGEVCAAHGDDKLDPESVPHGERPAISNITVSVCADRQPDEPPTTDCVPCRDDNGNRVAGVTFEYDGSEDDVSITIAQRGNGPQETVTVPTVDSGDSFTVQLNGRGRPDFDVTVTANEGVAIGSFHTSCSQPFGPGTVVGDGSYTLTVVEAVDKSGRNICEVTK